MPDMKKPDVTSKANLTLHTPQAELPTAPCTVTEERDYTGRQWPSYAFGYKYSGSLIGIGAFIDKVTRELLSIDAVTESVQVTNLSRIGSLAFGTTDIETEWVAYVNFHIQPTSQTEEVQRRMREVFRKAK